MLGVKVLGARGAECRAWGAGRRVIFTVRKVIRTWGAARLLSLTVIFTVGKEIRTSRATRTPVLNGGDFHRWEGNWARRAARTRVFR